MHVGVLRALNSINSKVIKASKYGIFEGYLQFLPIKTLKVVFTFFKTNSHVFIASKFISVFQVINMVSIKRYNHFIH